MSVGITVVNDVHFAHHSNTIPYNVGDDFCAPYHYFRFEVDEILAGKCLIIGGGTITEAESLFDDRRYAVKILWAVGSSTPFYSDISSVRSRLRWLKKKLHPKEVQRFSIKEKRVYF